MNFVCCIVILLYGLPIFSQILSNESFWDEETDFNTLVDFATQDTNDDTDQEDYTINDASVAANDTTNDNDWIDKIDDPTNDKNATQTNNTDNTMDTEDYDVPLTSLSSKKKKKQILTNVVTNNPICTEMAEKYLREWPNITTPELFIITSMCEGIVHPMDSGLGGGFQAVIHKDKSKTGIYINSRERSGSSNVFPSQPGKTAKHIGVPSMLKGYAYLYLNVRNLGYSHDAILPWPELFRRNINLAMSGFVMSRTLQNVINLINLSDSPWYYNKTTQKLESPVLGKWLQELSKQNPRKLSFYSADGKDHKKLIQELQDIGATLQSHDITLYKVKRQNAQTANCLNFRIHTTQLPGSGFEHLFGCKILEYAINNFNYTNWPSAHRFIFNIKVLHYMQSMHPHLRHLERRNTTSSVFYNLLTRDAKYIANFIYHYNMPLPMHPVRQFGKTRLYNSQIRLSQRTAERGTSNICIRDSRVTFCATSTINWGFGSCISSRHFGFFYNNQLADFTYKNDRSFNRPRPNHQPQSSISPVIFTDRFTNTLEFAMGAAGGRKIISSIFLISTRFIYERQLSSAQRRQKNIKLYDCARDEYIARCVWILKPYQTQTYTFLECEDSLHPIYRQTLENYKALVKYSVEAGYSSVTILTNQNKGCADPRRGGKSIW